MTEAYPLEPMSEEYYEDGLLDRFRKPFDVLVKIQPIDHNKRLAYWRKCADARLIRWDEQTREHELMANILEYEIVNQERYKVLPF